MEPYIFSLFNDYNLMYNEFKETAMWGSEKQIASL